MSDWPFTLARPVGLTLGPMEPFGCPLAADIQAVRNRFDAAAVWPAANRALACEVYVEKTVTAFAFAVFNGATVNGNVSVGIYSWSKAQLVQANAAMSGASTVQVFDITDTILTPGRYYLAMSCSSATATFQRCALAAQMLQTAGVLQMATAYPLPDPITYAAPANAYFPAFTVACGVSTI